MKQKRLTHLEKTELFTKYQTGNYTAVDLSKEYNITNVAISALLKRHGFISKSQSELQRKYFINENFFDIIDTEEKSYILGLLYADGYNNINRNSVNLSLQEKDKKVLEQITELIQPTKPLQFILASKKIGFEKSNHQYRLVIANKHISNQLLNLGCIQTKTFKITFPTEEQVPKELQRHFIRGYFDGDGYIGICKKKGLIDIVGTKDLCDSFASIFKNELNINTYQRQRFPERKNNIWSIAISGNKQIKLFCDYIYNEATIYIERKHIKYKEFLDLNAAVNIKNYRDKCTQI